MTRSEVREWLGGKSLRDFKTEGELYQHFESATLVYIKGNMWTFEERDEARALALKMWREINPDRK